MSYDAVIVGSGAGGGVAAWVLASAGWRVLVLERGPWFSSEDFSNDEIKFGERAMIDQDPSVWPRSFRADAALGDRTHSGRILPGSICVGGSTVHYCGVSFRAQPGDFRLRSLYGEIEDAELRDWPLDYWELEPYYTKVEDTIGISGRTPHPLAPPPGVAATDDLKRPRSRRTPYPVPEVPAKHDGALLETGARRHGLHPFPTPLAITVRPTQAQRQEHPDYDGHDVPGGSARRPLCINCGHCCGFGCPNGAKGSTLVTTLAGAVATGNCDVRPGAYVREVLTDGAGRATGVLYATMDDAGNTADHLVDAGVVILSAGTIETPNIALRSPGLLGAGREDLFGRFVTVHVYPGAVGWFDERVNWQLGVWSTRCLDDWYWPDLRDPAVSFIKGGNVQNIGRTAGYPLSGPVGTAKMGPWGSPGFQARLPEDRRDMGDLQRNFMEYFNDHLVVLGMVGEALPRYGNRVDQDPSIRDPFGSPAPRITYDYHPMDIAMTEFYTPRLAGLLEAAGAYATAGLSSTIEGQPPGGVHVHGSMRMGEGPGAEDWSVTDRWGKIRGVEGVYVADASLFTSSLGYNPALTVQALSWRTAEHLVRAGGA